MLEKEFGDLTQLQMRRLFVLLTAIAKCEDRIIGKFWCDECAERWKKIWALALRFREKNEKCRIYKAKLGIVMEKATPKKGTNEHS